MALSMPYNNIQFAPRIDSAPEPRLWPRIGQSQRVAKTREAVAIERAEFIDYKPFLGNTPINELQESEHLSPPFNATPIGPIIDSVVRIRGAGIELKNIYLGLYQISSQADRWRLTNQHDREASVIITFDFTWSSNSIADDDSCNVKYMTPELSFTVELRAARGRIVRDIVELYAFLRALREPKVIEIIDGKTSDLLFTGYGVKINDPSLDDVPLLDALEIVQGAFPASIFPLPGRLSRDKMKSLLQLAEIVRSGHVTQAIQEVSLSMDAQTLTNLLSNVDQKRGFLWTDLTARFEHTPYTLFGINLDLGPSQVDFPTMKLLRYEDLPSGAANSVSHSVIPVVLVPADHLRNEVHCTYSRFAVDQNRHPVVAPGSTNGIGEALDSAHGHRLTELNGIEKRGERTLTSAERDELDKLRATVAHEIIDEGIREIAQRQDVPTEIVQKEIEEAVQRSSELWAALKGDPTLMEAVVNEAKARHRKSGR